MPTELVRDRIPSRGGRTGGPGGGPGPGTPKTPPGASPALIAVGGFLAAVAMLFIAFTTAYLARRQETGWIALAVPPALWINTAVLLASSGTLEWARRRLMRDDTRGLQQGLGWTAGLGATFLVGQVAAWRELAAQGIYLASNPHSSFFYLLTGAHGVHLLGGLGALAVVLWRAHQGRYTPHEHTGLSACALYWHCMAGLWLGLFVLLFWA